MKNLFFVTAILFFGGYFASAQDTPAPGMPAADPNAPTLNFEFETYDFGDINEGDEALVDFVFTNTGKEKLIITDVNVTCGCTTPFWSKDPVLPGEKGQVSAKYDTKGKSGPFTKPITITSNASEEIKRIYIKGNVIPGSGQGEEISNTGSPERAPSIVNDLSDN